MNNIQLLQLLAESGFFSYPAQKIGNVYSIKIKCDQAVLPDIHPLIRYKKNQISEQKLCTILKINKSEIFPLLVKNGILF